LTILRVPLVMFAGLLAVLLATGCAGAGEKDIDAVNESPTAGNESPTAGLDQPYAGWESRPIRALDAKLIDDLLAGRGADDALAAELNHHPDPTHVLKMVDALSLSAEQEASIQSLFDVMQVEARLDQLFSDGSITNELLQDLTRQIALADGRLRSIHRAAHREVAVLLSQEQIDRYDALRGYNGDQGDTDHSQHDSG
jgi:hypothetical protein